MAKNPGKAKSKQASQTATVHPATGSMKSFSWATVPVLSGVLMGVALLLYGNTLFNQYALDDGLMFTDNTLVKKGFAGIADIFSHDSSYGTLGDSAKLNGGRWRPLSLISYAIEYQFFGLLPWISHLINVLLYGLTGIVLMNFLQRYLFKGNSWIPFFTAFLFVIHPVHTEVVANIKSRDEIFSLLFLILTLEYIFKAVKETRGKSSILIAGLYFMLALLSKENGLMFLFIIPVTLYFFTEVKWSKIIGVTVPFVVIVGLYILLRISFVGFVTAQVDELMDNTYLLATTEQRLATIFHVFLYYLRLLVFPHPLTYDYSYNQIPYHHFTDVSVLVSLLIHISLAAYVFKQWKRKDKPAWCILFYLSSIFLVSNLVLNVGPPLAERFLYQPSIAFCLAIVILADRAFNKIAKGSTQLKSKLAVALSIVVFIPAAGKTIGRNMDWKNNSTLFIHDQKISDQSARAATFAAQRYSADSDTMQDAAMKKEYHRLAIEMCYRSYTIYKDFANNYMNWGAAYARADSLERAEWAWNEGRKLNPYSHLFPEFDRYLAGRFFGMALEKRDEQKNTKELEEAVALFYRALKYDSLNAEYWYNLGVTYFNMRDNSHAIEAYEKAISIKPDYAAAICNIGVIHFMNNEYDKAESYFQKTIKADPNYADGYGNLGSVYQVRGENGKALPMYEKAIAINPKNTNYYLNLSKLYQSMGDKAKADHYRSLSETVN